MSASTATATTATAEARAGDPPAGESAPPSYVGRFAPSPTGLLHLGSLATAVASRLDALSHGGRWLLRIDDLDRSRSRAAFADHQRRTLAALGFAWDGERRQSEHDEDYATALSRLGAHTYSCWCTRRELAGARAGAADAQAGNAEAAPELQTGYPGTCRDAEPRPGPSALRLRLDDDAILAFEDRLQGVRRYSLSALGDPVLRGRDGIASYQLAVVVDDAAQGVNAVVRGADLLPSTAWQCVLHRLLGLPLPSYLHLPLVTDADGAKLSKSRHSLPLEPERPSFWLHRALDCLRQTPPRELVHAPPAEVWAWATEYWNINRLRGVPNLQSSANDNQ